MQKLKFLILSCSFAFCVLSFAFCAYAQDNQKLVTISQQIMEAKTNKELFAYFEELADLYFRENKYNEFIEFLQSLSQQRGALGPFVDYYTALARYEQLKHLEEAQEWDEYFSLGNNYRDQVTAAAGKAIDSTNAKDALNIYSRLLLWQFHKGQQDGLVESGLADLMQAISGYAKETKDAKPIREVADKLSAYGEKGKSKELYQLYVHKLVGSVKEAQELENIALGFYKEANLELSEAVYDIYVERLSKRYSSEKLIPVLINIARDFSYSASGAKDEGRKDAAYAQKLFQKIEELGTKNAFDEELTYLRAFNAEKMKDYPQAGDLYFDLLQRYPQTKYADEAEFKVGIISTYILRDIKRGRDYFGKLAEKPILSPQVISGLYQLGLLAQWENDLAKAEDYYNGLLAKERNDFSETVALAQERLKEIRESKPIEYKLKTFLDVSLKEENPAFAATRVDLNSSPYSIKKDESAEISCTPYAVESGCLQVETQYLWSGHLGSAKPPPDKSGFNAVYAQRGTKEINLVVISPAGVLDRNIELVDVY